MAKEADKEQAEEGASEHSLSQLAIVPGQFPVSRALSPSLSPFYLLQALDPSWPLVSSLMQTRRRRPMCGDDYDEQDDAGEGVLAPGDVSLEYMDRVHRGGHVGRLQLT